MLKLLDFWAEWCIDPQTPVLTENGYLLASNIKVGQRLIAVDPKTYKKSLKVIRRIRTFENTQSRKIVLETGRTLIGDINHLVLTEVGFKNLAKLEIGDKVLVDPTYISKFKKVSGSIILETSGNKFADKILKQLNLLPLNSNNPKLMTLARLLGFVMTDGYLYQDPKHNIYETHFFVGHEEDPQALKRDLQELGFEKLEIKSRSNKRQIKGRDFTITTFRCRNLNRSLFFLLKALGAPVGRKKNQTYFVPDWVMAASDSIQREFLSGWLGGDGCKIDYYIKHGGYSSHHAGFKVNAIEFHKEKDLEREGTLYAKQLGTLLEKQGIKIRLISSIDDEDGVIISLKVSTGYESLLNLAKIGYAYAVTKNANVPLVREFLKYRLFERNRYEQTKVSALKFQALGISDREIALNLQIPLHTAVGWRYNNRETNVVHPPHTGEAIFTKWLETRQQQELLWEEVVEIEDEQHRNVVGITVDAPHTIVTSGIISHNCGPCKFMEPIMDELEKELAAKIKIEKVNVDEHPDVAAKYGVMSIPTYIILKDDKEVERIIGATFKDNLARAIAKHE